MTQHLLSIGEVSRRTGLSADTLRFYERENLLPTVERSSAGRRMFTEEDVEWIGVCRRLRDSGMPLARVAEYAALVRAGSGNEAERLEMLRRHEADVRRKMAELQDALDLISFKVEVYSEALQRGTAGELFVSDRRDDAFLGVSHPAPSSVDESAQRTARTP